MIELMMERPEWGKWAGVVFDSTVDYSYEIENVFGTAHPNRWRKAIVLFNEPERLTQFRYLAYLVNSDEDAIALSLILDAENTKMVKYS